MRTSKNASGALSRRKRERLAHQNEIIEAAERVFVRKGFDLTTVDEIAREADFSVGTIYNFFKSKEKLCTAVINKIAEDFLVLFRHEVLTKSNLIEAISALILLRLRHVEEHGGFVRLFLESKPGSRISPDSVIPASCRDLYDKYIRQIAGLFRKGIASALVKKVDPLYAALSLEGVINAFSAFWRRQGITDSIDVRVRKIRDNFLHLVLTARAEKLYKQIKAK